MAPRPGDGARANGDEEEDRASADGGLNDDDERGARARYLDEGDQDGARPDGEIGEWGAVSPLGPPPENVPAIADQRAVADLFPKCGKVVSNAQLPQHMDSKKCRAEAERLKKEADTPLICPTCPEDISGSIGPIALGILRHANPAARAESALRRHP